ncbi:MAG: hypothetical protein GWN00_06725, partial [Aliifodinibius sp.]|nr:hypothetical protein [candidate division Zixibacteria bacterium]NIT55927.1 hypothetical protein [Fodinibius sp.]NIV08100.1 hypothetical protein [candidate division Zixibacteria bacterium]NIY24511.1 hypothetical protein [Fodinibius sp.]
MINSFPAPDSKTEIFQGVAIDIDFESNLYIVDRGKHQLLKFDRNGRLIKSIGGFGEGEEQFDDPRDVYAQKTVNVYVADYNNNRVVRYDKNLNFINALSSRWPPPFQFDRVLSIAVSSQSDLFLLEDGEKKVIKFNRFSEPAEAFGGIHETYGQLLEPV